MVIRSIRRSEIFAKQIFEFSFRIKVEQPCGLLCDENKDFSCAEAQKDFGFSPLSFEDGIKIEIGG